MDLLSVQLSPSTSIITTVLGNFLPPPSPSPHSPLHKSSPLSSTYKDELLLVARTGGSLDCYGIRDSDGSLVLLTSVRLFSNVRSLCTFRPPGHTSDSLLVGCSSGTISLLELAFETGGGGGGAGAGAGAGAGGGLEFRTVHCETFGKSGVRRGTPGQYLACDPKGRACMISAVEKQRFAYVLNRDASGRTTISSPLEAHKSGAITFATVGLDVGYENPIFATLEVNVLLTDSDPSPLASVGTATATRKMLTYYELDLGLNHVSRRWTTEVERTANLLGSVPGGGTDRGGSSFAQRTGSPTQKKNKFFALAQTELGDVFKLTLCVVSGSVVSLHLSLLDTLPVSTSLNITKKGLLFAAAEFGDHTLYQFDRIDLKDAKVQSDSSSGDKDEDGSGDKDELTSLTFKPSTTLRNLHPVSTLRNLGLTTGLLLGSFSGSAPTGSTPASASASAATPAEASTTAIYALCGGGGTGGGSSVRVLRHGAGAAELAVSDLPGTPSGIFTVRGGGGGGGGGGNGEDYGEDNDGDYDKYIVVSFLDASLILSIGASVEEVSEESSGFLTSTSTIFAVGLAMGQGEVQVHPNGVRHVRSKGAGAGGSGGGGSGSGTTTQFTFTEWLAPGLKRVLFAHGNSHQIVIALGGGELILFELDVESGVLAEVASKDLGEEVTCVDVGEVPKGRVRSEWCAVGTKDNTVRVLSLSESGSGSGGGGGGALGTKSSQATKASPTSVSLVDMVGSKGHLDLFLTVGLQNGVVLSTRVDPVSGALSSSTPTSKFLGSRPVKVSRVTIDGSKSTLLLSSRPWITHSTSNGSHVTSPLSYPPLDHSVNFSSSEIPHGIVGTVGSSLRILLVEEVGEAFAQSNKVPLRYTPRGGCLISGKIALVESDHNEVSEEVRKGGDFTDTDTYTDTYTGTEGGGAEKAKAKAKAKGEGGGMEVDSDSDADEDASASADADADADTSRKILVRGPIPPSEGRWGSCVRLIDPSAGLSTCDIVELSGDEAAVSVCAVQFHSRSTEEVLLAVGTTEGLTMHPMRSKANYITLYRIIENRLLLLYKTPVSGIPLCLTQFQGRLLAGVGGSLALYDIGKKQLLRKTQAKVGGSMIRTLDAVGDRIFAGDMQSSMHLVRYDVSGNELGVVCDDLMQRAIVAAEVLDFNTVACSDKWGNVFVLRAPPDVDNQVIGAQGGGRALWDGGKNVGKKFETLCHFCIGEVVSGLRRGSLIPGGTDSVIYTTVSGRVGALMPITSRDDVEFYSTVEIALRNEVDRPVGSEPANYRASFIPVKHVVDGELLELYGKLKPEKQKKIAEGLDRTVEDVVKKLAAMCNGLI